MGKRKNAKKQGNAVVAVAVADATEDVPADTATEKVAWKSKKKQGMQPTMFSQTLLLVKEHRQVQRSRG